MIEAKLTLPLDKKEDLKRIRKSFKPLIFLGIIRDYSEVKHEFKNEERLFFRYPEILQNFIFRIIIGEKQNEHNCKEVTNEL